MCWVLLMLVPHVLLQDSLVGLRMGNTYLTHWWKVSDPPTRHLTRQSILMDYDGDSYHQQENGRLVTDGGISLSGNLNVTGNMAIDGTDLLTSIDTLRGNL
jgi:hypothetical protein